MNFRKLLFASGLLGIGTVCVPTQADEVPVLRAEIQYASSQVIRGVQRTGAATQLAVEIARENWRGRIDGNQPFASGQERQLALGAAYVCPVVAGVQVETSLRHAWFARALAGGAKRTLEAAITATLPAIQGFSPHVAYTHDFRLLADTVELGAARSFALTSLGAFLDCAVFSGWATGDDWRADVAGPRQHDSYRYWGAEVQLPYRIGAHTTLITRLNYTREQGRSTISGPAGMGLGENLWISAGVSFDF